MPRDIHPADVGDARPAARELATGRLLRAVAGLVPVMKGRGRELDRLQAFPAGDVDALRDHGILLAPLPSAYGGLGLGTEAAGAFGLFDLLRLIGSGSLAVGRIVEGHINAIQLICLYGDGEQIGRAAADAAEGHLFAIWNTETPPGVRLAGSGALQGRKDHGTAAGTATRPLITVDHPERSRMLLVSLAAGERAGAGRGTLHGMRATQSGGIDFDGYEPAAGDWIGSEGDYLREPAFSAGAWRALAVMVGGIEALVGELRSQLRARDRHANPHQSARIAEALIAQETAFLWTRKAACLAESGSAAAADITGYVGLARRAVEMAALEAIQLAQRSLGLPAFVDTNPVELIVRDLATYLRQPAMDAVLTEAGSHFAAHALPDPP